MESFLETSNPDLVEFGNDLKRVFYFTRKNGGWDNQYKEVSELFGFVFCKKGFLPQLMDLTNSQRDLLIDKIGPFVSVVVREVFADSFKRRVEQMFNGLNVRVVSWIMISDEDRKHAVTILKSSYRDIKESVDEYIRGKLLIPIPVFSEFCFHEENNYSDKAADYQRAIELERSPVSELKFEEVKYLVTNCGGWYLPREFVLYNLRLTPEEELFLKKKTLMLSLQNLCVFQLVRDNANEKIDKLPPILKSDLDNYKIMLFQELCTFWQDQNELLLFWHDF